MRMISNMDKGSFIGNQEMYIKETLYKTNDKVMVKCTGKMEASIRVFGLKVFKMVKDSYSCLLIKLIQVYFRTMSW